MSFDSEYILKQVCHYNSLLCHYNNQLTDDLLYRIASHADILGSIELHLISQNGSLIPEQRYLILNWLESKGYEITGDLALLIFGRNQLIQWLERSRQAYPDFEFYLCFEYQHQSETGWESGINRALFWKPLPGSPMPATDNDFPWRPCWDGGDLFWGDFPGGFNNEFEFTLDCYPNQASFTQPGWICEEGDRYTMTADQDADLMSVAQVLEHFAVSV